MRVIGFSAYSGTGKTTLLVRLIQALTGRGLQVGVIKHDVHGITPCETGKDSDLLRRAGATPVILIGPETSKPPEGQLAAALEQMPPVDLCLVEGFRHAPIPRIGLERTGAGTVLPEPPEHYLAVVSDRPGPFPVPHFGFDDIRELTEFMLNDRQDFTHFNDEGRAWMVDVGGKESTVRTATAQGRVRVNAETLSLIRSGGMKKGDVLTVAQVAGIMGAKETSRLIPMCHPILLNGIDLSLALEEETQSVLITATVRAQGRTGVEMEALTAVSTAALTVYDMCKAVQKDMQITDIRLVEKTGGIHGDYYLTDDEHKADSLREER